MSLNFAVTHIAFRNWLLQLPNLGFFRGRNRGHKCQNMPVFSKMNMSLIHYINLTLITESYLSLFICFLSWRNSIYFTFPFSCCYWCPVETPSCWRLKALHVSRFFLFYCKVQILFIRFWKFLNSSVLKGSSKKDVTGEGGRRLGGMGGGGHLCIGSCCRDTILTCSKTCTWEWIFIVSEKRFHRENDCLAQWAIFLPPARHLSTEECHRRSIENI